MHFDDVASANLERDFLLKVGVKNTELQDLAAGGLSSSFWPRKGERIAVCLPRRAAKDVKAPSLGWWEGDICGLPEVRKPGMVQKFICIKWRDSRVNKGKRSWIDSCKVVWVPTSPLRVSEDGNEAATCPDTWLRKAASGCSGAESPELVFLTGWWTEARRGVVRLCLTPSRVACELRELHEARQFLTSHMDDKRLWRIVNSKNLSALADLEVPPSFVLAVREARHRGAVYISPFGVYVAPSVVIPQELGLFSLLLFHPCEFIGNWEGEWLWEADKDKFKKSGEERPKSLQEFPNAAAILKYGMRFQNHDTVDGQRKRVSAMIDSCRGCNELTLNQVRERNEPFGFMNEPPVGQSANCEVQSRVNVLEEIADGNRYSLLIAAMVPIMPHTEILIHYGCRYDRAYSIGKAAPQVFESLMMQSPGHGDFAAIVPSGDQAEISTDVPSTPLSTASSSSSCRASASPDAEAPIRSSKRLREKAEREVRQPPPKKPKKAPVRARQELPSPGDWLYVHLDPSKEGGVPHPGWFEALLLTINKQTGQALLRWSHDRVSAGMQSYVDLRAAAWAPCVSGDALALLHDCPWAWLERAVASVQPDCAEPSLHIFFARWWVELRWGFVRFNVTPREVIEKLQEQEVVRRFIATVGDEGDFWQALTKKGGLDKMLSSCPTPVATAITEACKRGARCFLKYGLFVAPSHLHQGYGLHTLSLLHPSTIVGVIEGGLNDRLLSHPEPPPRARRRWKVGALSTPSGRRRSPAAPLAFLAAPLPGHTENCLTHPLPNKKVLLTTTLPVLPMGELLALRSACPDSKEKEGPFDNLSIRPASAP